MNLERFEALMVMATDGVISAAEREELMSYLADKPQERAELDQHLALKAVTDGWMARLEADLMADRAEASVPRRAVQGLGVLLLALGLAVLSFAGPILAIQDPEVPLSIKAGIGLSIGGAAVLLLALVAGRLRDRKHDPYTEVIR